MQRVIDQRCRCETMWTLVFSLETEGLRDFTDWCDLKAVICVHMTTRAIHDIPAQFFSLFYLLFFWETPNQQG